MWNLRAYTLKVKLDALLSPKTKPAKNICTVYGDSTNAESNVHKLFTRFRSEDFDPEDRKCPYSPAGVYDDQTVSLLSSLK